MVVDAGDQIETKAKTLPTIPITVRNDLETLQRADNMLVQDALARYRPIEPLVLRRQRLLLALFFRQQAVAMKFGDTEIPRIRERLDGGIHAQLGFFVQAEVVLPA